MALNLGKKYIKILLFPKQQLYLAHLPAIIVRLWPLGEPVSQLHQPGTIEIIFV